MRIHFFQHEPFEKPFLIEEWAISKGAFITKTNFFEETALPNIADIDWLIIMGGSMSVNDEHLPWIREEKAFIKKAIETDKVVLGICLGAQMIAKVLGSRVFPNKEKEIGWMPVTWTKEALSKSFFSHLPLQLNVMHWHGETFDLPAGAIHLASTEACKNQAFLFGNKILGLQFHMEFNETAIDEMLLNCSHELIDGRFIQSKEEILAGKVNISKTKEGLIKILDALS